MFKPFFTIVAAAFAVMALGACDKEKDYDKTKAVSAFALTEQLVVDPLLEPIAVKIPAQVANKNWGISANVLNQSIENFAFAPLTGSKKFLNKNLQIWSGYRPSFSDRFVFAPIIKDEKIFLLDASGILASYCLEGKEKLWENRIFPRHYLKNYQNPRLGYFDGKIFAIAGSNQIVAASEVDGKILWSKTILSLPVSTPISDGKLVYFTTNDNKTYALDASNGKLEWVSAGINKPTAIFGSASPVIYKNSLIVAYSSGEVYALNKNSGEPLWSQDLNLNKAINSDFYLNDIDATPIVKDDTVYSIGNGGLMMAIDAKNGRYLWKKEIAGIADFWLAGEFLYVINNDDKLVALRRKSGGVKWISQLPNFTKEKKPETKVIYNGVILAGDKLLVSDSRGKVLVASPFDGKIEVVSDKRFTTLMPSIKICFKISN